MVPSRTISVTSPGPKLPGVRLRIALDPVIDLMVLSLAITIPVLTPARPSLERLRQRMTLGSQIGVASLKIILGNGVPYAPSIMKGRSWSSASLRNWPISISVRTLPVGLVGRDTVEKYGFVSRMDEIQAAILRFRLKHLSQLVQRRRENARLYRSILNSDVIFHPAETLLEFNTWHTFVIQVDRRDQLQEYLKSVKIETSVHYPVPIHLQPASVTLGYSQGDFPVTERQANRILTLPVHQHLAEEEISRVATTINDYFEC